MPPIDIKTFIDSGAVALLITLLLAGFIALAKGLVVPKPFYEREVKRADTLEAAGKEQLSTMKDLTEAFKENTQATNAVVLEVKALAIAKRRESE